MKRFAKRIGASLLAAFCLWGSVSAQAETYESGSQWQVTFRDKMESNFRSDNLSDVLSQLEPGDDAVLKIRLSNENELSTGWYMKNEIINSLEDASSVASGGAYSYRLAYQDQKGEETVFFDSATLGGEMEDGGKEGLHGAGESKDYFFLGDLASGEAGTIVLAVGLDGETQNNTYQNTLADMKMEFAVEPANTAGGNPPRQVVKTGDDTNLVPFYIMLGVSGVLLLLLAFYSAKKEKKKKDPAKG